MLTKMSCNDSAMHIDPNDLINRNILLRIFGIISISIE
jgi:hypothetical protein